MIEQEGEGPAGGLDERIVRRGRKVAEFWEGPAQLGRWRGIEQEPVDFRHGEALDREASSLEVMKCPLQPLGGARRATTQDDQVGGAELEDEPQEGRRKVPLGQLPQTPDFPGVEGSV